MSTEGDETLFACKSPFNTSRFCDASHRNAQQEGQQSSEKIDTLTSGLADLVNLFRQISYRIVQLVQFLRNVEFGVVQLFQILDALRHLAQN